MAVGSKPTSRDVVVRVMGGLGNQLFQYAFGIAKAKWLGGELWLDASHYATCSDHTGFELAPLVEPARILYEDQRAVYRAKGGRRHLDNVLSRVRIPMFRAREYKEKVMGFDPVAHASRAQYFRGYWQSPAYWRNADSDIIAAVRLFLEGRARCDASLLRELKDPRAVALHVRLGDYVSLPSAAAVHGVDLRDYYRRAIRQICGDRTSDYQFYIFSDDKDPVSYLGLEALKGARVFSGRLDDPYTDLVMMAQASHLVMANSSFSWWAGCLGEGKTYAPDQWVLTQSGVPEKLYLKEWQMVGVS